MNTPLCRGPSTNSRAPIHAMALHNANNTEGFSQDDSDDAKTPPQSPLLKEGYKRAPPSIKHAYLAHKRMRYLQLNEPEPFTLDNEEPTFICLHDTMKRLQFQKK